MLPGTCNCDLFARTKGLSLETFTNNRRFLMVFPLLTAALFTPPDIWCQIVARFLISLIIELAIFVGAFSIRLALGDHVFCLPKNRIFLSS
ncbi:unnamed protein product [Brassica napus]|uniref:(rape) hypothetical protein n=1 Tax=Brassica napus TaxID=3708 RepID=A0A816IXT6_BRANA|nr:unnamed protein product [Brassica napus]